MMDKDAKGAADRFMAKLKSGGFTMPRLKTYSQKRRKYSPKAVAEFTKTRLFKDILKLC